MDEIFGVLFFLLVLAGSALEAYFKAKKKREAEAKAKLERASKRPRPVPARAGPPARAPERPGAEKVELPTELLEWLRQGRAEPTAPERTPPASPPTRWEEGKAAEEEAEAAAEVVSLERVARRPEREPFVRRVPVEGAPRAAAPGVAAARAATPEPPPSRAPARRRRPTLPRLDGLTLVQRAFMWAEILGPPVGERDTTATAPPGLRR